MINYFTIIYLIILMSTVVYCRCVLSFVPVWCLSDINCLPTCLIITGVKLFVFFISLANFFQLMRTLLSLYNSVWFQFCFVLTISPEECHMKSFRKKNLLLHAIFKFCTTKRLFKYFFHLIILFYKII